MKITKQFAAAVILLILAVLTACGSNTPPDDGTPEPPPHEGVFTSEYGTMTFTGDGETVLFDFAPELADAAGLPVGEQSGSYVFLFRHEAWRWDKADRLRITVSDASCDFLHDFTLADENTVALLSPMDGNETIRFIRGGN